MFIDENAFTYEYILTYYIYIPLFQGGKSIHTSQFIPTQFLWKEPLGYITT